MVFKEIAGIILAFVLVSIGLLYWHRKKCHQILSNAGVVGPKPHWLFGNLLQLRVLPMHELIPEWTRKYGRTWGYYEGPTPIIVTSDVELLQEVFVKQFRNFHGRKLFPVQPNPDKSKRINLFLARGQKWKQLRSTLNPSFTESRMKQMFPLVDRCIETMLNAINDEVKIANGQSVNLYKFFQGLTLDSICECAFGVQFGTQNDPNSIIIEKLRTFFGQDRRGKPVAVFGMIFPELRFILNELMPLFRSKEDPVTVLVNLMRQVIKQRKKELKENEVLRRVDILQLLLDSEVSPLTDSLVTPTNNIDNDLPPMEIANGNGSCPAGVSTLQSSSSHKIAPKKYLEEEEITAQAVLFLFAGYETSSTTLAYCVYELVRNPQILSRLHDEIDSAMQDLTIEDKAWGSVNFYRTICRLPYLEAVIWETLRYYPFASSAINRNCVTQDVQVGKMKIPQGVIVAPDVRTVHYDEDIWGPLDVKKFDPDRHLVIKEDGKLAFTTRDHAMAMLAFGAGPRNCIGQRFALMEIRACLVRLLSRFTLMKSPQTPDKLPLKVSGTVAPADGVWVKVIERNE